LLSGVHRIERFEDGGATLVDEVSGESACPPLVFLHGWGANRDSLRGIAALFEHSHVVHRLDLPGFGEAPPPPADWDTRSYATLVERYLSTRVAGPVVLVGHSFGARVAIRLAARRLPGIRAVVLMAAPGLPPPLLSRVRLRRRLIRGLRGVLRLAQPLTGAAPIAWHTRRFGSSDYLAAGDLRPVFVRVVREDYTGDARAIACPVLLLCGSDDRETPPWIAERFKVLMNGRATLDVLPHKDHYLYLGTGAHLCAFKIRSWLESHVRP
jgi:pimeloyl-ACP methyl ester carboxylesterase